MPTLTPNDLAAAVAEPDYSCLIRVGDEAALATDVYLPARAAVRVSFPTLLVRTPYGRRGGIDRVAELARYFREVGIALVVQDVRGRYDSEGALAPFRHEQADGRATLDWIGEQPWSDGAVFPFGDSYAGFTAWAAAASGHPSIRGAIVRVTTPEIGRHWMYRQGMFRLQMNAQWAAFAWGGREAIDVQPDWSTRPLGSIDFGGADMSRLSEWLAAGSDERLWQGLVGDTASRWAGLSVPVLHWGGWWDLMARGQLEAWQRLVASGVPGQRLLMGATDHSFNGFPPHGAAPPSIERQLDEVAAFVADTSNGAAGLASTVRWELTHDDWHAGDSWPPASARPERLFLADPASALFGPEGGALSARPERMAGTVTWAHDPADLVPSLETFVWGTLANNYPDERDVQVRDDVVTFSGAPVDEPLDIAGTLTLHLRLEASAESAQVAATLSDVRPDGAAWRIAEGASVLEQADGPAGVQIDLGPLAYRVKPGHRLRLALAASSFPRYLWAGRDLLAGWRGDAGKEHELSLRVGVDSYLELPLCR
ncbi:MAG: CocE/NonD family hydrolase [Gaiellaceae bacterium]